MDKGAGGSSMKKPTLAPLDAAAPQQSAEEGMQSWIDQWSEMTEEEQEAFKEAEKKQYLLRATLVYKPKGLNRVGRPVCSTLRDKNGWIRAKPAGYLNVGVS